MTHDDQCLAWSVVKRVSTGGRSAAVAAAAVSVALASGLLPGVAGLSVARAQQAPGLIGDGVDGADSEGVGAERPAPIAPPAAVIDNSLLRMTASGRVGNGSGGGITPAGFFSVPAPEPRTFKKHELVTIIVREQSQSTSEATTELSKEAELTAALTQFISLNPGNFAIQGGAQGATPPRIGINAEREFSGDGSVERTDSTTARIQAEVVDVRPNGNLVLQATKYIRNDDEEQRLTVTGQCRAEDITADNTVLSTQLHDLSFEKLTRGAARDTSKRGFVPRLVDRVNPF